MKRVSCDYCGSTDHRLAFTIDVTDRNLKFYRYARNVAEADRMTGAFDIVTCNNCGLMFTNPRFDTEELGLVYASDKVLGGNWQDFRYLFNFAKPDEMQTEAKGSAHNPKTFQWKFDIIKRYTAPEGRALKLLDLGCGDGKFVYDALQQGFDAHGIDLSPDRIAKGQELYQLGDRLRCMNVDSFDSNETFDVITMWDVIEHVESPSSIFESLKQIAHPETRFFVLTMSLDSLTFRLFKKHWNYMNPTQHLHFFSHASMERMMNKAQIDLVGAELDNSRDKHLIHLSARILVGQINQFFYRFYNRKHPFKFLFKPFEKGAGSNRMQKRIENLYPGKYVGRYHDNFVFIGKPQDA